MAKVVYKQHPDVSYEQELELLANIYRLALESYRRKKAAEQTPKPGGLNDVRKDLEDAHTATEKYSG